MKLTTTGMILLVTVVCITSSAGAGLAFSFDTLIDDENFNNAPALAVDEAGVLHVAYTAAFDTNTTGKEVWYARRAPAQAWEFQQISENTVREEFPSLALDDAGNVHIAFHTGTDTTNKVRYTNNIGQAGLSFNPVVDITGPGFVIAEVEVDSKGLVHFVFTSQNNQSLPTDVFYTTFSMNDGVGALVNLSNTPSQNDAAPQLAIGPDDAVHIVWQRGTVLGGALAYVNDSTGSFQPVPTGIGSVLESFIVVDDAGVVSILYRPGFDAMNFIESNDGMTFTSPQPVYTGAYRSAFIENVAVDANGNRYVAFSSNISANRGVFLSQETENGWQAPQFLENGDLTNLQVSTSINAAGDLAVVYSLSDFENDTVVASLETAETTVDLGACPADLVENDNAVNVFDLLELLANWGTNGNGATLAKPTDVVNLFDLLELLANWGSCG